MVTGEAAALRVVESAQVREDLESYLARAKTSTLLRFSTAGSVDDGKSTLIGRLLHDSKNIYEDHLAALHKKSAGREDGGALALALLTDGLRAEQEQGITIDVAYRYFSTPKRRFILADSPGHEQYTRNMATGASTADLTILLVDARKGVITQTKRHAFIASLLGVPRLLIAINKMDLVDYSEDVFNSIRADFVDFAGRLGVRELRFVPIAALPGDNVVEPSSNMPWYHGETVMEYLESVYIDSDANLVDFRFPVQYVIRPNQDYRGFAGQIASGTIRVGEEVTVLPAQKRSKVKSIEYMSRDPKARSLDYAFAPMSVTISLEDEIDTSRGDMIVRSNNLPRSLQEFEAMVVWMSEAEMDLARNYIVMHTTRETKATIQGVRYGVDVNTLHRLPGHALKLNEIGRVSLVTKQPLFLDPYERNRATGNFILIDPESFLTVGAGMIIDRLPQPVLREEESREHGQAKLVKEDLHREESLISRADREQLFGHQSVTLWFTGLSGSGKSSIAKALERKLFDSGRPVYRLDGDNLRFGLNSDLAFSKEDRAENIRRVAEVARLFNEAGITVIASFISPYAQDREMARKVIGGSQFIEIHLSTPIEVCESRDPHGLYKKARSGGISDFTGIDSPYEAPTAAEITLDTASESIESCVAKIVGKLIRK